MAKKENGWVYLIKCSGKMKAGVTKNSLKLRLRNYDTHSPVPIELIHSVFVSGYMTLETSLLSDMRVSQYGNDWVEYSEALKDVCIQKMDKYLSENPAPMVQKEKPNLKGKGFGGNMPRMTVPFTQVANSVLNNPEMTVRAKGLFAYLYSKPDGWDFSYIRIAKDHKESKNTILKTLSELEKFGYLVREKMPDGRVEYNLHYDPNSKDRSQASKPNTKVGRDQSWERPKLGTISNKDSISNKEENTNTLSENEKLIPEVIDLFKNLNPAYQRLFGRVNQRESCQRMLETHGFEKIQFAIKYLEHCVQTGNRYCPIITTPLELEDKWGKLQIAYSKEKVGTQKGGVYKI